MCGLDHLIHEAGPLNFWVLHAATKVWALDHPDQHSHSLLDHMYFYGKLYLQICFEDGRVFVYSYDTHNSHWTSEGGNSFTHSFLCPSVWPASVLSSKCVYSRWMNWVSVIFRRLEGCLDRMPSFNHEERSVLVDLDGKGTFLVMLPGFAKERRQDPVLCVLVLQVIVKKVVSHPSRIPHRSVRSPMECDFLDWKVLSMNMYSINRGFDDWFSVSLFPGIPCNKAITYEVRRGGKRKCNQI
ncbi:hypothetical protein HN51_050839 [Arachis hypogaea]